MNTLVGSELQIQWHGPFKSNAMHVEITDLGGKTIGVWNSYAQSELNIESGFWPAGIYLVKVGDGEHFYETRKVIKR